MKMNAWIFTFSLIFTLPVFSQRITFFREDLDFKLSNELFEVDGLYFFRNNTHTEIRQMLFYPFPETEKYGDITYIQITPANDTTSMLTTQTAHGAMFKLMIPPEGEVACRIKYGQKIKSNVARYIITTTQKWEKPFEKAAYSLQMHNDIILDSISILPDSVVRLADKTCFYWKRKNFMPVCDFDFFFRK